MYIWWWAGCLIWLSHSLTVQTTCITTFDFLDNFQEIHSESIAEDQVHLHYQIQMTLQLNIGIDFFQFLKIHVPVNLLSSQMPDATLASSCQPSKLYKDALEMHSHNTSNDEHSSCTCMHSKHCSHCSKNAVAASVTFSNHLINIVYIYTEILKTKNVQKLFHGSFL